MLGLWLIYVFSANATLLNVSAKFANAGFASCVEITTTATRAISKLEIARGIALAHPRDGLHVL